MYMDHSLQYALKMARERADFTQKEVEQALELRSLMMRDYESGRIKLPIAMAMKLSKLYKVSLDELVGNKSQVQRIHQSKVLANFNTLFLGNGFGAIFLDPVIRAFLEDHQEKYFEHSLFDLLTNQFSDKQKKELVTEICRLLFSVASADRKISDEEIECIKYLLSEFKLKKTYRELSATLGVQHIPEGIPKPMERIEVRHFTIWILFFFAYATEQIGHEEIKYIEKCGERLKINKTNFLFIKSKFVKEKI